MLRPVGGIDRYPTRSVQKKRCEEEIDDFNRESLAIEVDTSLPTLRLIRVLDRLIAERGVPSNIRCDNGPEFISHKLEQWCNHESRKINLQFIQPGKPMQNAYIERKNGSMRRELLNTCLFTGLSQVRELCNKWREDYNNNRPHKALGYLSPIEYALKQGSTAALPTPASRNPSQIAAKPVVDKAGENKKPIFENSNC